MCSRLGVAIYRSSDGCSKVSTWLTLGTVVLKLWASGHFLVNDKLHNVICPDGTSNRGNIFHLPWQAIKRWVWRRPIRLLWWNLSRRIYSLLCKKNCDRFSKKCRFFLKMKLGALERLVHHYIYAQINSFTQRWLNRHSDVAEKTLQAMTISMLKQIS